ncbi:hypothetical protein N7541_001086 [Penicillium brevicompactum]|uniref:Acyltransferase 3 domain-containing protein n=1 Tax=Penicillium brevicompactum TaxID=5074 RepID=A0A9W9RVI9_PENBR|nr:hypothetical protein N7541_001086 [Penicillium brevicompactum]
MPRLKWVDGLRGTAAILVAYGHYFNYDFPMLYRRTYWTEPFEENRRLAQLPPFNLLWSLDAMVPLFYVIAGYSLANGLLELRDQRSESFFDRLRSSAVRRFIRLVLPLVGLGILCQLIFYTDWFIHSLPENAAPGLQPWTSPWSHLRYFCRYVADNLQLFQIQYNHGLSQQLWTIPLDLRSSFFVYFVMFLQAPWRPSVRLSILSLMLMHTLWYGVWDAFSALTGLTFAEISSFHKRTGCHTKLLSGWFSYFLRFALATYLCSLKSQVGEYPLDYRILETIQPPAWTRYNWSTARFSWNAIGAVSLFSVLMQSPRLQGILGLWPFQYLGKHSFSIYLVHTPIYQVIRSPLRDWLWRLQGNKGWAGFEGASQSWNSYIISWVGSGLMSFCVVFIVAWSYSQYVNPRVDQLARDIDMWLSHAETDVKAKKKKEI